MALDTHRTYPTGGGLAHEQCGISLNQATPALPAMCLLPKAMVTDDGLP